MSTPAQTGRVCPLRYRYGAEALARAPEQGAETLYVIGGLYGNLSALAAIDALAARESGVVTYCFNGDFNWFNVDDAGFIAINKAVLQHDAQQGNVEAELYGNDASAGCGCAYPDNVDAGTVERSNLIHARLKTTALKYPALCQQLSALPMVRRYCVGDLAIGVVHGDAESLAGWRFDVTALDDPAQHGWRQEAFQRANVDVFASSHTCLPALRSFTVDGRERIIINNGAAGMPNFQDHPAGLITRISQNAPPFDIVYGVTHSGVHISAVTVAYDTAEWNELFLRNWPQGSSAHQSYYGRIISGPNHQIAAAFA